MVEPINPMTEPDSSSSLGGGGDNMTDDDQFAAMMFARNDSGVEQRRVSQVAPKREHRVSTV